MDTKRHITKHFKPDSLTEMNKANIIQRIKENPFISQLELAQNLKLSRSAVAGYISALMKEGKIKGRAYVLSEDYPITCIGGSNIDRKAQTIEPLQLETSNPVAVSTTYGGVGRNIAENLARIGSTVSLLSSFGNDQDGEALMQYCQQAGMDMSLSFKEEGSNTGSYTAVLDPSGKMVLALAEMQIYEQFTPDKIKERWQQVASSHWIILDTNLPVETTHYIMEQCQREQLNLCVVPVSVPKINRLANRLNGITLFIGNQNEVEALVNQPIHDEKDLFQACQKLQAQGCKQVVVTRGEHGIFWMDGEGQSGSISVNEINVIDVTGAGDAFVAGVMAVLNQYSQNLQLACQIGLKLSEITLQTKETVSTNLSNELLKQWLDEMNH